jgi:hypothetical protein
MSQLWQACQPQCPSFASLPAQIFGTLQASQPKFLGLCKPASPNAPTLASLPASKKFGALQACLPTAPTKRTCLPNQAMAKQAFLRAVALKRARVVQQWDHGSSRAEQHRSKRNCSETASQAV